MPASLRAAAGRDLEHYSGGGRATPAMSAPGRRHFMPALIALDPTHWSTLPS